MSAKVRKVTARDLIGRKIVGVTFESVTSSAPGTPEERAFGSMTLDNGREVWFRTIELEGASDYGIDALTETREPRTRPETGPPEPGDRRPGRTPTRPARRAQGHFRGLETRPDPGTHPVGAENRPDGAFRGFRDTRNPGTRPGNR